VTSSWQSPGPLEYIIWKHSGGQLVLGPDQPNFADYLYWFHFANGSFMAMQLVVGFQRMAAPAQGAPEFLERREESLWRLGEEFAEKPGHESFDVLFLGLHGS
jgi:glutathione S-transferase